MSTSRGGRGPHDLPYSGRENLLNISAGWDGNILVRDKTSTELLNGCLEHERSSEALHCTGDKIKL